MRSRAHPPTRNPAGPVPWPSPDAVKLNRDLNDTAALLELPVGGFEDGVDPVTGRSPADDRVDREAGMPRVWAGYMV